MAFARDRVVECYLWGTAFRFEPQYTWLRLEVAKSVLLVTIIDDTYDNYATLEEAEVFYSNFGKVQLNIFNYIFYFRSPNL